MDAHSAILPWPTGCAGTATRRGEEGALDVRQELDRFLAGVERRAFHIARLALADAEDAMDVVQEAMMHLARRYASRPSAEWTPLFYRILNNRIRDCLRRRTVRSRVAGWLPGQGDAEPGEDPFARVADGFARTPEDRAGLDDAMSELDAAIVRLPRRQREAFLLRVLEGLDVAETARAMGCSAGSVKTHYSRAVHALRGHLADHWP